MEVVMEAKQNVLDTLAEKVNAVSGRKERLFKVFHLIDPKTLLQTEETLVIRTRR